MTRLLVVTQYYWPESFTITDEVARLAARGFRITVLTGQPNYPSGAVFPGYSAASVRRDKVAGIDVLRVPLLPRGSGSGLRLGLNYLSFILTACLIGPFLLRGRAFDTVFVFAPSPLLQAIPGVLLSRLKRARLVVWVQDLWPESLSATGFVTNRGVLAIVRSVVRWIYRNCARILVQSEAFRAPVAALAPPDAAIHCVPNSVQATPADAIPSEPARALADRVASGFSVVFAGNLGHAQALDTLLDALELLRDLPGLRVFLVGSGSLDQWLREERDRRHLDMLDLPGRFAPADMPAILSRASALLVSLRREPIFAYTVPSKLQTYLSTGRPILASLDGEGARILAESGAGLASPAGDALALAASIRQLAAMPPDRREQMGLSGRRYFDIHFTPDRITGLLEGHLAAPRRPDRCQQGE